ncbi:Heterokaryon incompatibility protein 6, OR allele [Pseudocercospora fuligena]|uniref:Heterokaryon incompatibility protein 6, OR allele n=1 Tax=Pseudocercospora fuligena TaxID=685502 RepID=A0A8H6RWI9_9PEZI|nr:Heterokaryon incompatibility protein 6, OR allele [Pseudocercospora fuligena]
MAAMPFTKQVPPYQYESLSKPITDEKQIRVVTLHHGEPEDDLVISISVRDIHAEATRPGARSSADYEALSYTWGSDTQPRRAITVRTARGVEYLEIFQNLFTILQTLRLPDRNRTLWIDAICINQDDASDQARLEKSWQIPMMHEVYYAASRVIIWLGSEADDSTFGLAFLKAIGDGSIYDRKTFPPVLHGNTTQSEWLLRNWEQGFSHTSREHRAVLAILERPWFIRVWVKQEAFAASEHSIVMCRSAAISLNSLRNAVQVIAAKGFDTRHPNHDHNIEQLRLVMLTLEKESISVLETLGRSRESRCQRVQDKIYGCLGTLKLTASAEFVKTIPTDYPEPLELFRSICIQYAKYYGNLQFLYRAGLCQLSPMGGPSWMPDWNVDFPRLDLSLQRAASHAMRSDVHFTSQDILSIKGAFAGEISEVESLEPTGNPTQESLPQAVGSLSKLLFKRAYAWTDDHLDAFARAFCSVLVWLRASTEKLEKHQQDILVFCKAIVADGSLPVYIDVQDPDSLRVFQSAVHSFQTTQIPFIFTKDGYVGVGARTTRPGDLIAAVPGCGSLLIFRLSASMKGHHQLVGSCFMHGYNWGEALLGPLPDNMVLKPRYSSESGIHVPYYTNARTGESSFWDPRIDWTKLTPGENEPAYTINAPKGEPRRKPPDAQYLKTHHNAKIVDIELV